MYGLMLQNTLDGFFVLCIMISLQIQIGSKNDEVMNCIIHNYYNYSTKIGGIRESCPHSDTGISSNVSKNNKKYL